VDYCFIDAAAAQTRYDFAQNYDITTENAKKSVIDGIGYVASLVDNDKLIVDQSCGEVLRSLDQYRWDPNPNLLKEKPLHDSSSHMADAIRYALYSFEVAAPTF
ncbi:MAG: terminase, partial [bacterium]